MARFRYLLIPYFCLLLAGLARADELLVFPGEIKLDGKQSLQSLVVQLRQADGLTRDVTSQVKWRLENAALAQIKNTSLRPLQDGTTVLHATFGNFSATVPVAITGAAERRPLSFRLDVEPVFMRAGCNSGSCHGSARGQDGFRLSLFGYDPAGDYFRLTREMVGRRVDPASPEKSLLLEKSTATVTHTGGELFKPDSRYYATLREWIAEGARDDEEKTAEVTGIRLLPDKVVVRSNAQAAPTQQSIVMADYSDGTHRDVTSLALFLTNNDAVAGIDKNGIVKSRHPGGAFVFARFSKFTIGAEVMVLPESADFAWPDHAESANYVDAAVFERLKKLQIAPAPLCRDEEFVRRIYLDLTGAIPSLEETESFLAQSEPDKRERLVDKLLATEAFTDLWTMKWAEVLQVRTNQQNPEAGRNRRAAWKYHQWLREQIAKNRPFHEIVRDLVSAEGSNLANPASNYYTIAVGNKREPKERAEDLAQVFLGTRIQCAQCHNHPFDQWTMDDYYGFTAFFAGLGSKRGSSAAEVYIYNSNDRHTAEHPVDGRLVQAKFLGGAQPDIEKADPRHLLAQWLASSDNKSFARNVANRAWAHFFGRGIIEPVDDARISNPPSNEALLSVLAQKLAEGNFNIRAMVRDICTSKTYQLSSSANASNKSDDRNFSHAMVRRLQAEVLMDSLGCATGAPLPIAQQSPGAKAVKVFEGGAGNDAFLKNFGASKRETVCACEVRMEPTLTQTLTMVNGGSLSASLEASPFLTKVLAGDEPLEEAIAKLFVQALSRKPTAAELASFVAAAAGTDLNNKANKRKFFEDIMWSILNSTEFSFNH